MSASSNPTAICMAPSTPCQAAAGGGPIAVQNPNRSTRTLPHPLRHIMTACPDIDLSAPAQEAARALRAACVDSGFAVLRNHGVPGRVLNEMRAAQTAFFALPLEQKRQVLATSSKHNRGYR